MIRPRRNHLTACFAAKLLRAFILRSWPSLLTSQCAIGQNSTVLATVLDAHTMADGQPPQLLHRLLWRLHMLTDGRAARALALASFAVVLADDRSAKVLAVSSHASMLTDARAATTLASVSLVVLKDGRASIDLALLASLAAMLTDRGAAMNTCICFFGDCAHRRLHVQCVHACPPPAFSAAMLGATRDEREDSLLMTVMILQEHGTVRRRGRRRGDNVCGAEASLLSN